MTDHISKIKAALDTLGPGPFRESGSDIVNEHSVICKTYFGHYRNALLTLLNSAAALVAEHEAEPLTERRVGSWTRRVKASGIGSMARTSISNSSKCRKHTSVEDRRRTNPYANQLNRRRICDLVEARNPTYLEVARAMEIERDAVIAERKELQRQLNIANSKASNNANWSEYHAKLADDAQTERNKLRKKLESLEYDYIRRGVYLLQQRKDLAAETKRREAAQENLEVETELRKATEENRDGWQKSYKEQTLRAEKWKAAAEWLHDWRSVPSPKIFNDALAYEATLTAVQEDRVNPGRRPKWLEDSDNGRRETGRNGTKADRKPSND